MASEAQDEILKAFLAAAGQNGMADATSDIANGLNTPQESPLNNGSVSATPMGTSTHGGGTTSTGSSGSTLGSVATTFLESGLGIVPLITGLMGLFGGSSSPQPQFEKYQMPSSISFESADIGNSLVALDWDQTGTPRPFTQDANSGGTTNTGTSQAATPAAANAGATPQITVNVQAIDAQSFMDYSSQIAQAVRGAMLNLSSINDVVSEL